MSGSLSVGTADTPPQVENGRRIRFVHESSVGREGALVTHGGSTMFAYEANARGRPPAIGQIIQLDGQPWRVLHYERIEPGPGVKLHQLTIAPQP